MRKIIAVDFDGTLCESAWPKIGAPRLDVIKCVLYEQKNGAKLILWTCREGEMLSQAVEWAQKYGIRFDAVNANLPEKISEFGSDSRKIAAHEYWDDRARWV